MRIWIRQVLLVLFLMPWHFMAGAAVLDPETSVELARELASSDTGQRLRAIERLGELRDDKATRVLESLSQGQLLVSPQGVMLIELADGSWHDPVTASVVATLPEQMAKVRMNNRLRSGLQSALATSELLSTDPRTRLGAVRKLQADADPARVAILQQALDVEQDARIRSQIEIAIAIASLKADHLMTRLAAIETLAGSGSGQFTRALSDLLLLDGQGRPVESEEVRQAASKALQRIDQQQQVQAWLGNLFFGLSLGSVLLLAALGLAITFGLMGVINMAHGELLMIGAYSTYMVQTVFKTWFPEAFDWYVVAALPVAFIVAGTVGMVLERTVIRWLYGRPLETLLATWGISLILMQAVRTLFGAQNVEVANPSWMSGGIQVMGSLVLSYNRIAILVFALLVVLLVWVILQYTRLGLFVRAITQNRRMAGCVGVPTGRVDMMAFGLGAGIAGLAGVALSQLGNVGPDLGRAYLVDSFMVVVLGGVGQLAGTVIAAFGLGVLNKFIEPSTGAVIAKISILMLIILFVQKRPQGLFAPKGRSA